MDLHIFIACTLALMFGCFIQSLIGFGMGVIAAPIILWLEPNLMPSIIVVLGTLLSVIILLQYRNHLEIKALFFAFLGRLPGTFLAAYILMMLSESEMFLILGVTILITVFLSLAKINLKPTPKSLFFGGLFSGIMGTATGIGGPPIAILFQNEEPNKLRANLAAFFVITNIISLIALHCSGHFSLADFKQSLIYLPLPLFGIIIAYFIQNKVKGESIRYLVLILCSFSAITSLMQGLHI